MPCVELVHLLLPLVIADPLILRILFYDVGTCCETRRLKGLGRRR